MEGNIETCCSVVTVMVTPPWWSLLCVSMTALFVNEQLEGRRNGNLRWEYYGFVPCSVSIVGHQRKAKVA